MKYVSIKEAAVIKGISERAMYKVSKLWSFWGGHNNNEIDIDHSEWPDFLAGKRKRKPKSVETGQKKQVKNKNKVKCGHQEKQKNKDKFDLSRDRAEEEYISTLSYRDQKTFYEAKRIQLDVKLREGEIILRDLVKRIMEGQIQNINIFIDMAEKLSPFICRKLERVGKEQEIKKILSQEIKDNIQHFKKSLIKIAENYLKEKLNNG